MVITEKETCPKQPCVAGDLEKETKLLQVEAIIEGVTWETPVLSFYCC